MITDAQLAAARRELDREIPPVFLDTLEYDTIEGDEFKDLSRYLRENYVRWQRHASIESIGATGWRVNYLYSLARYLDLTVEWNEARTRFRVITNPTANQGFSITNHCARHVEDRVQLEDWFLEQLEKHGLS